MEELQALPQIPRFDKARPRSAGASQRPMRDEHLMELVKFFQMDKPPPSRHSDNNHNSSDGGPGPAVTATTATSIDNNNNHQPHKTGHRRLWQRGLPKGGTRKEKSSATASAAAGTREEENTQRAASQDLQSRQLSLLQQYGFLPEAAEVGDHMWDPSRPMRKRDVEAIGRPWLDDAASVRSPSQTQTNSSGAEKDKSAASDLFNLDDLTALFEWSVSFPEPQSGSPSRHERGSHENGKVHVGAQDQVRRGSDQGYSSQRQSNTSNTLGTPVTQPRRKHSNSSPAPMAGRNQGRDGYSDIVNTELPEKKKDADSNSPNGKASPTSKAGSSSSPSTEGQSREAKSEHGHKNSPPRLPAGCLPPPRVSSKAAMRNAFAATTLDTVVMSANEKTQARNAVSPTETIFSSTQDMHSSTPSATQPRRLRSATSATGQSPKKRKASPSPPGISLLSMGNFPHSMSPPPSPAPARPLPSVPEATNSPQSEDDHQKRLKPNDVGSRLVNSSGDKHDSPTLGSNNGEPDSSKQFSVPPPPSQFADSPEARRGISPARCESRLENRNEKFHVLRAKDVATAPAQKRDNSNNSSSTHIRFRSERIMSPPGPAPSVLLPADPPIRRGSSPIPSTPVSATTCGSYEGGVSRSVSIKSSSGTESSISPHTTITSKKQRTGQGAASHNNMLRSDPSLPSSDDEGGDEGSSTSARRPSNEAHPETVADNAHPDDHNARNKPFPPALALADSTHHRASEKSITKKPSMPISASSEPSQAQLIQQLEARIAALERQNRMLHAALIAALDAGVSHDAESLRSNPASPGFLNSPVQCQGGFWDAIKCMSGGESVGHGSSSLFSKGASSAADHPSGRGSWDGHGERNSPSKGNRRSLGGSNSV